MKKRSQTARRGNTGDAPSSRDRRDRADDAEDLQDHDKVGEASEESFPASDAPAFTATTGSLANGRDTKTSKHGR